MGVGVNNGRNMTRLRSVARTLTIINALEMVIHSPNGAGFNQPFEIEHLQHLEPYLFCTEEIAWFAITLMQNMWMNDAEKDIVTRLAKDSCGYPPPNGYVHDAKVKLDTKGAVRFKTTMCHQTGIATVDYNYLELSGNVWDLAALAERLGKAKNCNHSAENIQFILTVLLDRRLNCHHRTGPQTKDKGDKRSIFILERDTSQNFGKHQKHYLSTAFVDILLTTRDYAATMRNAVQSTFHKHTRRRTVLLGQTHLHTTGCHPHLFHTIEAKPDPGKEFEIDNTIGEGADRFCADTEDIETSFYRRRTEDIGLCDGREANPPTYESTWIKANAPVSNGCKTEYPKLPSSAKRGAGDTLPGLASISKRPKVDWW